ncbi:MAG: DUF2283 domain-containing protein [Candidatus Nanohaloarchaeota archaeon QJJ-7]|nr:DUF2283 domain-containing protein [Candidatus Nanohaloarchaeota archaeon QJJ-7]
METIDRIQYDEKGDVLYVYLRSPESVEDMVSEEVSDGVLVDKERETGEKVGYTIIDFIERNESRDGIDLGNVVEKQLKA